MDNIAEGMTLDDTRVQISPLVPSVILDYNMRNWDKVENDDQNSITEVSYKIKKNTYTIGVLLGTEVGSTIIVTNAFGVRYKEDTLNDEYINFMTKYMTKGTKETIVGMFHVAKEDQGINDFSIVTAYCAINNKQSQKSSKCLLLTMDGTLEEPTLDMKTYYQGFGNVSENLCVFVEAPYEVITGDMAATGLDTVLYGQENFDTLSIYWREASNSESITLDKIEDLKKTQRLFNSKEKLKMNIKNILGLLDNAKQYIEDVEAGRIQGDAEIDRELNNALSKITHITPESIENLVREHHNDLLFISKLTNLIQDQLSISQKLTAEIK